MCFTSLFFYKIITFNLLTIWFVFDKVNTDLVVYIFGGGYNETKRKK